MESTLIQGSNQWLQARITNNALIIHGDQPFKVLSSSIFSGGLQEKSYLVNMQVPLNYMCDDPNHDIAMKLQQLQLPLTDTVALMTAASVGQVKQFSANGDQYRLHLYVTAGVTNAARAGTKRETFPGYQAGTINIIAVIDGKMSDTAMVNAVITATEAKAAVLQELAIYDEQGRIATGTTTDAIIIASTQSSNYCATHHYAGSATELGNTLGSGVYQCLKSALQYLTCESDE